MLNKHRKNRNKSLPPRILILCEGESEIKYLKGFRGEEENRRRLSAVDVEIYQPSDYSPYGLLLEAKRKIKDAKKVGRPYVETWLVFDKDSHANIPKTFTEAETEGVKIAFSLICFEYWVLLHFERTTHYFANCEDMVRHIEHKGYIKNYSKTNYYNNIKNLIPTAIDNAKWLHKQNEFEIKGGTRVYDLHAYTNFDMLFTRLDQIDIK